MLLLLARVALLAATAVVPLAGPTQASVATGGASVTFYVPA